MHHFSAIYMFDCEVFPNWWCVIFKNRQTKEKHVFTSDMPRFDVVPRIKRLAYKNLWAGFYIKSYDMKIVNAICMYADTYKIYELSQALITEQEHPLNNYSYWFTYNFTDLFDDWLDGSLKEYEANKGVSIEETSVPFGKEDLTPQEKEAIIKYCHHDVDNTELLFEDRMSYLESKLMIGEMFDLRPDVVLKCTNAKLCALVLDAKPISIPFDTQYTIPKRMREYVCKNLPKDVVSMFDTIDSETKEAALFGNKVFFGVGGIHSTYSENLYAETDENYQLINIDVESYYPNLIIIYDYMSRAVKDREIYPSIFERRKQYKRDRDEERKTNGITKEYKKLHSMQDALKLILNVLSGALRDKYNKLYDPHQAGSMCYSGQLFLAALANKLYRTLFDCKILQTNTDGILALVHRNEIDALKRIVAEWEALSGFKMEYEFIQKMFQRDVNNYIEIKASEKEPYKLKGRWANQADRTVLATRHKNVNAPITHKALLNYYWKNIPVRDTIMSAEISLLDFCFTCKTGRTYDKTFYRVNGKLEQCNKVNRVYATLDETKGTILKYKIDEDRYDKISEIPEHCTIYNQAIDAQQPLPEDLDKAWYIAFAENKIKELTKV